MFLSENWRYTFYYPQITFSCEKNGAFSTMFLLKLFCFNIFFYYFFLRVRRKNIVLFRIMLSTLMCKHEAKCQQSSWWRKTTFTFKELRNVNHLILFWMELLHKLFMQTKYDIKDISMKLFQLMLKTCTYLSNVKSCRTNLLLQAFITALSFHYIRCTFYIVLINMDWTRYIFMK